MPVLAAGVAAADGGVVFAFRVAEGGGGDVIEGGGQAPSEGAEDGGRNRPKEDRGEIRNVPIDGGEYRKAGEEPQDGAGGGAGEGEAEGHGASVQGIRVVVKVGRAERGGGAVVSGRMVGL